MKNFLYRIQEGLRRFMVGRYGTDQLNRFLTTLVFIFIILGIFIRGPVLPILEIAGLGTVYYRMMSRNFVQRGLENRKFLALTDGARKTLRIEKRKIEDRNTYRYFKCPFCGQEVRVPKGRGHIRITCPKCHGSFDKNV